MTMKLELYLHIATALVSAATPFFLDSFAAGFILAAISVANAVIVAMRNKRGDGSTGT